MKEEDILVSQQKLLKEKHPFSKDTQRFRSIPKQKRSEYILQMLQVKQNPNPPAIVYIKDYPSSGKFTYQNYQLHYHSLQQTQNPKAIFIYLHGMNAHGGGSGYLASIIAQNNPLVNIYSFDQMNFGQSKGPYRGEIRSFEDSVNQLQTFTDFLMAKFKSKPKIFIGGGSYGGTISLKASTKRPQKYSGIVFLAPALRNLSESAPIMKKIGKIIGFMCPRIRLFKDTYDSATKFNQTQRIGNDPYVYNDGHVPGSVRTILNAMDEVSVQFNKFQSPYLLFQAGIDKMVDPFAPLDLQQECKSKDKTTIYCQKMFHAVLAEDQMQVIAWKTSQWIRQRI